MKKRRSAFVRRAFKIYQGHPCNTSRDTGISLIFFHREDNVGVGCMVTFFPTKDSLRTEVFVNNQEIGYIERGLGFYLRLQTNDDIRISPKDLKMIADRVKISE